MLKRIEKFLKLRNERLYELKIQSRAYSNVVYTLKTDMGKYIYKEFKNRNNNEILITLKAGPEIFIEGPVVNNEDSNKNKNNEKIINKKSVNVDKTSNNKIKVNMNVSTDNSNKDLENKVNIPFYRIEKYLEHDEVNFFRDYLLIAKTLNNFHKLKLRGISSYEVILEKLVNENLKIVKNMNYENKNNNKVHDSILKLYNQLLPKLLTNNQKICHMDLQGGNMLKIGNKIRFIDFEYACLAHPALDIANFFCEVMTDYGTFELNPKRGFNEKMKFEFIAEYLKDESIDLEDGNLNLEKNTFRKESGNNNYKNIINQLVEEVQEMEKFSHLYWYLWGRKMLLTEQKLSKFFNYKLFTLNRLKFLEKECELAFNVLADELLNIT
ncbi:putative choline kinase 3 [Dictyocoela muelleri]|nr:putative choline kinase 3 [Dictyocoela muelleri]